VSIKQPGAPATVTLMVNNSDDTRVPQRVNTMLVSSSTAQWNSKAVARCKPDPPNNQLGHNDLNDVPYPLCPSGSKVGTGTFTVNTGTPGEPIPTDLGTISGSINIYNHTPAAGQSAAFLIELLSDIPVPNDHEYELAQISKSGTVTVPLLNIDQLSPAVKNILSPPGKPRQLALSKLQVKIKSPTPKKGAKPFVTLKSVTNVNFRITLER
jgi:hypothetical protein